MRKIISIAALFALSACGTGTVVKERIVKVSVPVSQPCIIGERPAAILSLKEKYPDWYEKSPKQQAELFAIHLVEKDAYGISLFAVTSACK